MCTGPARAKILTLGCFLGRLIRAIRTPNFKPTTVGQVVRAESLKASLESGAGSSPGERRNLKGVAVGRKEKGDERGIPKRDWLSSFAMKSLGQVVGEGLAVGAPN